jgi:hypothetical protein
MAGTISAALVRPDDLSVELTAEYLAGWRLSVIASGHASRCGVETKMLQRPRPRALGPGAGAITSDQSIQGVNLGSECGTALRRGAHPGARPPLDEALV